MPDDTLLPFLAVFAATSATIFVAWLLASRAARRRAEAVERRLQGGTDATVELEAAEPPGPPPGVFRRLYASFAGLMARTGLDLDAGLAAALILLSGVTAAVAAFVLRFEADPWLPVPAFFAGAALPLVFFLYRQGTWRKTLQEQMPDVFFLLARSLRAGRSMDQAMALVGEQGVPPLSYEFARMHHQVEFGLPLAQVLQTAARRIQLVDFNTFAAVVSLHRSTGGNLPLLLDRLAGATRDRNRFEGQYRAATVLGRYSAAMIAALATLIVSYLYFVHRDWALRFFESGTGVALFCTAVALEACGLLLLFWMLRTEY
jgi:tight adherence protein B